jgi:hypothetical protein
MVFSIYHLNPIQIPSRSPSASCSASSRIAPAPRDPTMAAHAQQRDRDPGRARRAAWARECAGDRFIDRHPALAVAGAATLTASGIALALLGAPGARR